MFGQFHSSGNGGFLHPEKKRLERFPAVVFSGGRASDHSASSYLSGCDDAPESPRTFADMFGFTVEKR
jgi:hypothetical protein